VLPTLTNGNDDGTPDSEQAAVASLPSATGEGYTTVETNSSQIQDVQTFTEAEQGNDPDFDYPYGLVGKVLKIVWMNWVE